MRRSKSDEAAISLKMKDLEEANPSQANLVFGNIRSFNRRCSILTQKYEPRKHELFVGKKDEMEIQGVGSFLETNDVEDKVPFADINVVEATETEELQIAGVEHISMNNASVAYSRRVRICRRKKKSGIPNLPIEIIFNILVCLPAEIIYDVMRCVCRQWHNMVHDPFFINEHLLRSNNGILIHDHLLHLQQPPQLACFVEPKESDVKITKLRFCLPGRIWFSYNGLVLFCDRKKDKRVIHVANPITKQQASLPPLLFNNFVDVCCSCLGYVASTGEYKVVHVHHLAMFPDSFHCSIFTLGIDNAWRQIDVNHISLSLGLYLHFRPVSEGRFIYWCGHGNPYILCLDLKTEKIQQFPCPKEFLDRGLGFGGVGGFLSMLTRTGYYSWEHWVLREPKTGVWTKMPDIDIQGQRNEFEQILSCSASDIIPVHWMNVELLIFAVKPQSRTQVVYNIKTGVVFSFTTDINIWSCGYRPHICSLVSPSGPFII